MWIVRDCTPCEGAAIDKNPRIKNEDSSGILSVNCPSQYIRGNGESTLCLIEGVAIGRNPDRAGVGVARHYVCLCKPGQVRVSDGHLETLRRWPSLFEVFLDLHNVMPEHRRTGPKSL
eukprot:UN2428